MTANTFCRHLSNGYRIYINQGKITWKPCCYWQDAEIPFDNIDTRRSEINVAEPWYHRACDQCGQEEIYKTPNGYREIGNRIIPVIDQRRAGWIDIQADLTCNGGCLTCGPWSSSYWQSELAKYQEWVPVSVKQDLQGLVDSVFQSLDVSELRILQFLGGEPFLSDVDSWAMRYITRPEQCILKYTTNGSVYPKPDRVASWQQFEQVIINFSIDGIGSKFEYLRHPLQWSRVEDNIKRFLDENSVNLVFHINHTVTPLNIWYYDEFIDWVDRTFPSQRFKGIHTHPAYGVMSVSATNGRVRQMVRDRYGNDHILSKMLADNPYADSGFSKWIQQWDQRRGTDWRLVFGEIA